MRVTPFSRRRLRPIVWLVVFFPAVHFRAAEPTGLWAQLFSPDLKTYAANLRNAGAPEETVGLLVSQAINARFKEREDKLRPSVDSLETLRQGWSAERREALLQLKQEKNDLLRSLFGVLPAEVANPVRIPETLGHLTKGQREMVRLIVEDYDAMNARVFTESYGVLLEEDREKLRYLESARDTDLVKAIGEADAINFQVATSRLMQATVQRLKLFQPTAQELRDLFLVRRKYGYEIALRTTGNPGGSQELKKKINAELEQLWGKERFAAYVRTSSAIYQQTVFLVQRLGKPPAVADQIYDHQVAAREAPFKMMDEMRTRGPIRLREGELPPRPGDLAKQKMGEHCEFVKQLLGDAGYEEYYRLNSRLIDMMNNGSMMRIDETPS